MKNKQKWKRRIYYESIRIQKMQHLHESIKNEQLKKKIQLTKN